MDLVITIDSTDRSNLIEWDSLKKEENQDEKVDTFEFKYKKYGLRTWRPGLQEEIIVTDNDRAGIRVFAGRIVKIDQDLDRGGLLRYKVKCQDYTVDLDEQLIAQTFENKTAKQIIDTIKPAGFTSTNVIGTPIIERISFNYQPISDCIRDLAELLGCYWYVDYNKDIHFFQKSTKTAPFNITDASSQLIGATLSIDKNHTQMRNRVIVRGGEYVGNSRSEIYEADGEQDFFPLSNKFSDLVTVEVNTGAGYVAKTVGVDPLKTFADGFEVLWNFNEKFVQFDTKPNAGDLVRVTGTPLVPLIVQVEDSASILQYGLKEYKIEDKNIIDPGTARKRGQAELTAYAEGLTEGAFLTYTDGLQVGQTIRVNSTLLNVDEYYIINKIKMQLHSRTKAVYEVSLASTKSLGIIAFLQMLLRRQDKNIVRVENEVLTIVKTDHQGVNVLEEITREVEKEDFQGVSVAEQVRRDPWGQNNITFVWGDYFPANDADPKRPFRWDRFYWA